MSKSAVIGGKELILSDWKVLAVCSRLDFETGGTMKVSVYFDPELDPELRAQPPSADDYKKYFSDPAMIALAMKQAKPGVKRSPQITQILALEFASRDHDPFFDWVLDQKIDELSTKAVRAVEKMGRLPSEATQFLADLLSHLGQLDDWAEVNRRRFSGCRLVVDAAVANSLSLVVEDVAGLPSDYVSIHLRRFG